MIRNLSLKSFFFISIIILTVVACKKDNKSSSGTTSTTATPTLLGLYGADSSVYKLVYIVVSKVGTQSSTNYLVFDTGSGGMVLDASEYLPSSAYTSSGFTFTGDSTIVNGITITNQTSMISYGDDSTQSKVYGNLAYAPVTIGDSNGNVVVTRVPFFLYYKALNSDGSKASQGDYDTFGVSPQYDITFTNGAYITSPFNYFDPGTGLTRGFKLAELTNANFSYDGTYINNAITLGLTSTDLSSTSGFNFVPLTFYSGQGYFPLTPATVTYNSKTATSPYSIFDTGTDAPYSFIEDGGASTTITQLAASVPIAISSSSGFKFSFSTSANNVVYVENPKVSGTDESIFGLQFFLSNEYLVDYTDHKLGIKNN